MKILYAVQRYHESIVGGSESACRQFAERLAARGHSVEVVTSCALDYRTWSNELQPGTSILNGVTVHRLPTMFARGSDPRHDELFAKSFAGPRPLTLAEQREWTVATGPSLAGYERWLRQNAKRFDVAIFMTYLYATTTHGIPAVRGLVPVVLQPTAHDESPIWLSQFDFIFKLADGMLYFTPEEREFVEKRFRTVSEGSVIGLGFDPPTSANDALPEVPDRYLIYVGRWDQAKGVGRLIRYVEAARRSLDTDLQLVVVGEAPSADGLPAWVRPLGFLSERAKAQAIRGSVALVQPSYFESFSIVLFEAWSQERPVLVQDRCGVLKGQVERSGGGFTFRSESTFIEAVRHLLGSPLEALRVGASGRRFVEDNYLWSRVLADLESSLTKVQQGTGSRRVSTESLPSPAAKTARVRNEHR